MHVLFFCNHSFYIVAWNVHNLKTEPRFYLSSFLSFLSWQNLSHFLLYASTVALHTLYCICVDRSFLPLYFVFFKWGTVSYLFMYTQCVACIKWFIELNYCINVILFITSHGIFPYLLHNIPNYIIENNLRKRMPKE